MKNLTIFAAIALVLLTGCATQYQKIGFSGGFIENQFSRNEFAVSFAGNGYTSGQRAIDLCMLRCAELALCHDFQYFILTANNAGYDTSSAVTVGNFIPTGYGGGVFVSTTQTIPKPSVANKILCFRKKPAFTTDYFNAQNVFDELSQKYGVHRAIEEFPKFELPIADIGVKLEVVTSHMNPVQSRGASSPTTAGKTRIKIQSFIRGSMGQKAGLHIGDEICSYDGVKILDLKTLEELTGKLQLGQIVQVSVRRNGKDLVVPVKTVCNPALRFRQIKDIKCSEAISENDVVAIEGVRPTVTAFPIAEYTDWENPLESVKEIKRYLVAAAVDEGANGVLILNSQEEIKNLYPNVDDRIGFLCSLLIIPKARLGVEFETGTGYENRRIVRRILNPEVYAAGLQIGDNVLAVNGIDWVLNASAAMKDCMKWNIGQEVEVTVARNGKELTIPMKATENHL